MLPSGTRPRTRARGTFADTPFAHVLVYIRNKRLTGTLTLFADGAERSGAAEAVSRGFGGGAPIVSEEGGREACFDFWRGQVVTAQTAPPIAELGSVAYELQLIDGPTLDAVTETSRRERESVADLLRAWGAITPVQCDVVLAEQMRRRVHFGFTFPPATEFLFEDAIPGAVPEPPLKVDVLAPLWRGIVDFPPDPQIAVVLERLQSATLTMVSEAALERAGFDDFERAICERLTQTPMPLGLIHDSFPGRGARINQLVYLLMISKCAEPLNARKPAPDGAPLELDTRPHRRSFELSCAKLPVAAPVASPLSARGALIVSPRDLGVDGIQLRARMLGLETAYEALGLHEGAPAEAARAAYIRLSKLWHPHHLPPELSGAAADAMRIFHHITEAYRTIVSAAELAS